MHHYHPTTHTARVRTTGLAAALVAATATLWLAVSTPANAGENGFSTPKRFGAGIDVNTKPNPEETGLPLYPGATVERERRNDDDAVNLNLWFGSYGLRVVVVKLKSGDDAAKVESFYRDALKPYGEVLDCSEPRDKAEAAAERKAAKRSKTLTCSDTQFNKSSHRDGKFFKAGTRDKQYGFSLQADGSGSTMQLFHFEKRGGSD